MLKDTLYTMTLVDNRGGNVIEYKMVDNEFYAFSSKPLTKDQMKQIENKFNIDRCLGIYHESYLSRNGLFRIWSILEYPDCDWS